MSRHVDHNIFSWEIKCHVMRKKQIGEGSCPLFAKSFGESMEVLSKGRMCLNS